MFLDEKNKNFPHGSPLICINGIESVGTLSSLSEKEKKKDGFLDFNCIRIVISTQYKKI